MLAQRPSPNGSSGNSEEGALLVGIESAGIDPTGSVGHVQSISRVGPAPSAEASGSSPVTVGSVGSSLTYTCDASINAVAGVCTTLNSTIAALYTHRFTDLNVSIYVTFGSTGLGQSDYVFNSKT
jgi:hypothetical protein